MMIDLKYHIYSLVAVFLALTVGIVIGSSFTSTSPVEQQAGKLARMEKIVRRMEGDFALVRAEIVQKQAQIDRLKVENERAELFSRAALPSLVKDKLAWRNVAIIQTGSYDIAGQIKGALELAGANVTSVTRIVNPAALDNAAYIDGIARKLNLPRPNPGEQAYSPFYRAFAAALVSARNTGILAGMQELKVITRSGDYDRWNKLIVVVGGQKRGADFSERIDAPLIESLIEAGARVVGCEPSDATQSYIRTYRRTGIATIDNADKAAGQVSLICALAGENGHFGTKNTADRFIPASIERRHR